MFMNLRRASSWVVPARRGGKSDRGGGVRCGGAFHLPAASTCPSEIHAHARSRRDARCGDASLYASVSIHALALGDRKPATVDLKLSLTLPLLVKSAHLVTQSRRRSMLACARCVHSDEEQQFVDRAGGCNKQQQSDDRARLDRWARLRPWVLSHDFHWPLAKTS
jgi:hypothetical protein